MLILLYACFNRFARRRSEIEEKPARSDENPGPTDSPFTCKDSPGIDTPSVQANTTGVRPYIWEPVKLVLLVILGFSIGFFIPWSSMQVMAGFTGERITSYLLYLLLFFIGIDLSRSGVNIRHTLAHPETLLLPVGTIIGSLLGGLVLSGMISLPWGKALALSSGVGWYSLSGVIITDLGDPVLGSIGFMANLFRESIALLFIPLISRTRFPHIGIGIAGATSMDVTLPLIQQTCGPKAVPLSVSSGAILSMLVPVLVPIFYHLG
jgi:uncharacterized membrane protein YbjE (DUF340 family)